MRDLLRRAAGVEALKRMTNDEALDQERTSRGAVSIVCECADLECAVFIDVSRSLYRAVREHPARFVVVSQHVQPEVESVVADYGEYRIVEKIGPAATFAADIQLRLKDVWSRLRFRNGNGAGPSAGRAPAGSGASAATGEGEP